MERPLRHPFILPIIILLGTSGIVTPVMSMELVNGILGHSVDFIIPVSLSSEYRIDWNFGYTGKVTVMSRVTSGGSPQYNPLYKGRCELFINGTLRLNSISYADEGTYKVKLFNPDTFTSYVQQYQLSIYAILSAPVLNPLNSSCISGTHVTLNCDAGKQTVTTYTFYRDQKSICSEPHVTCRRSFLEFTPIMENDSGSYTCTIQNPVSTSTSNSIIVTVLDQISAVMLSSSTSRVLRAGKDTVSFHCSAKGSAITFSWSQKGKPVSLNPPYITQNDSPQKSTLTISPISKNDTGPFTCSASNSVSNQTSNELKLSLKWYPEGRIACKTQEHDNILQLDCSWPGGQPAANVTMIFNNIAEMGQNEVTRNVSLFQSTQRSNLTCIGDLLGKKHSCALIFSTPQLPEDKNNAVMEGETANLKTEALP